MHPTVIVGGIPWAQLSVAVTVGWTRRRWLSHLRDVCHAPDPIVASLLLGEDEALGEWLWPAWQIQHRWFLMQPLHLPAHEEHQSQVPSATPEFHISLLIISVNCNKPVHGFYLSQEVFFNPSEIFQMSDYRQDWLAAFQETPQDELSWWIYHSPYPGSQPIDLGFRSWILST